MIEVAHLTKKYPGGVTAVHDVSFSVDRGEVVGFLGPNGAGKSTTMRILSGYISPSGGDVRIDGLDVTRKGVEVRRKLGYLPESCPLYSDMRAGEYLRYRADLKGVPHRHRRARVDRVMEQCGLGEVRRRLIGNLSKGYRQRVGIADALLHSPPLLILDEPTIGLDPNQIVQIRNLIRDLSREHTLLISSHILSEIEATCDRVIVICQGRIVESAPLERLGDRWFNGSELTVEARADADGLDAALRDMKGLKTLRTAVDGDWCRAELRFIDLRDRREEVYRRVRERDWDLRELHLKSHSLEEAFVNMTSGAGPVRTPPAAEPAEETSAGAPAAPPPEVKP